MTLSTNQTSLKKLIQNGEKLELATKHYPSRGQSAIQELYQTKIGKLFLKSVSLQNHKNCQIDPKTGTLAERELWAYQLARHLKLNVPELTLLDPNTTIQIWLNYPDAHQYSSYQAPLSLKPENVFECALFDWLTGQIDRHDANYLYNYADEEIILIDSAHCFLKYDGSLPDYLRFFEISAPKLLRKKISTPVLKKIQKLTTNQLHQIVPLIQNKERNALNQRLKKLKTVTTIQHILQLYRGIK